MLWNKIWKQAMTRPLPGHMAVPCRRTVGFPLKSPLDGTAIRVLLSNEHGTEEARLKGVSVELGGKVYELRCRGDREIRIPAGGRIATDAVELSVARGDILGLRLYPLTLAEDLNYNEMEAFSYGEELLDTAVLPPYQSTAREDTQEGMIMLPYLEGVELCCAAPVKAIVAFGDSITAMSRWTKPLAERLSAAYGQDYVLLNAGISGNCLSCEVPGPLSGFFGVRGTERFARDVLSEEHLSAVIFEIGTNDISRMVEKDTDATDLEKLTAAMETVVGRAKAAGLRTVGVSILPRLVGRKEDAETEEKRRAFNAWAAAFEGFDYFWDWGPVGEDPDRPGWLKAGFHQGDGLHPSFAGGRALAAGFDLEKLTGEPLKN